MSLLKESLKDFFQTKKDWISFGGVFFLFLIFWSYNYSFRFAPLFTQALKDNQIGLSLFYFLFFAAGAMVIYPIVLAFYGKLNEFKPSIPLILGYVVVLAIVCSARIRDSELFRWAGSSSVEIAMLTLNYVGTILAYTALPLAWILLRKNSPDRFLGLSRSPKFGEVLFLLGLMLPVIAIASFSLSFLSVYPRFAGRLSDGYLIYPPALWIILFEISYAADFAVLETFFRGFMVFPLASRAGSKPAVLGMAFMYGLLHFTKPSFEALGSFFGGFILGMISYRTKSVYAGILIHIGVALAMELAATLQFLYFME
ncbi:CPBP family intramembrane glutamic endopeptidase [Leptospira dzoumogneensis]|uniref:CPBP family intramembrane metalloprotease n=1 Tax=Leptospira dzoumogneensis TaxID=2484904 RepID=A0A4Z1ARN6_9LEPT|nr:CPBP family intramembrane glutamic endopeptidase [Leptospira dzoumogneensis]TGM97720.1 CPBP family intramembrane metalloprotease [Leptospira dzoumogneensis]